MSIPHIEMNPIGVQKTVQAIEREVVLGKVDFSYFCLLYLGKTE